MIKLNTFPRWNIAMGQRRKSWVIPDQTRGIIPEESSVPLGTEWHRHGIKWNYKITFLLGEVYKERRSRLFRLWVLEHPLWEERKGWRDGKDVRSSTAENITVFNHVPTFILFPWQKSGTWIDGKFLSRSSCLGDFFGPRMTPREISSLIMAEMSVPQVCEFFLPFLVLQITTYISIADGRCALSRTLFKWFTKLFSQNANRMIINIKIV